MYTKAINKDNRVSTYFTNRALCYINLNRFREGSVDCLKACELDKNSVKGYYFLGRCHVQLENFDEAIKHLAKAIDLAEHQKANFGDEIHNQLRIARREKFKKEEDKRIQEEIGLVSFVEKLIDDDLSRKIGHMAIKGEIVSEKEQARMIHEAELYKSQLNSLLAQVDEKRRRREIPDYLCGKISFELMKDPVITPSGITYDRDDIKKHLQRVGHFDPVTRAPLKEDDLVPNLAMKEVVEAFMVDNPWAEFDDVGGV